MKVILEGEEAVKYAFAVKLFNLDRALELSEKIRDNPHINNELKDALRAFLEECKYINARRKEQK